MEQNDKTDCTKSRFVKRRGLLKTLAAAGGAVTAASLLPGKWSKPIVNIGVLPAHAAISGLHEITDRNGQLVDGGTIDVGCQIAPPTPGISMTLEVFEGALSLITTTAITDAAGVASLLSFNVPGWTGNGATSIEWRFTNPTDGVGTCSRVLPFT